MGIPNVNPSVNCQAVTIQPARTSAGTSAAVAADEQEQREWNAAAGHHRQVAVLGEPERSVSERSPCDYRAEAPCAELVRKKIRT